MEALVTAPRCPSGMHSQPNDPIISEQASSHMDDEFHPMTSTLDGRRLSLLRASSSRSLGAAACS